MTRFHEDRCAVAGSATNGVWECRRDAGHAGPCAAELVTVVPATQCAETMTFYEWDRNCPYRTQCNRVAGHDGDHRGEVTW